MSKKHRFILLTPAAFVMLSAIVLSIASVRLRNATDIDMDMLRTQLAKIKQSEPVSVHDAVAFAGATITVAHYEQMRAKRRGNFLLGLCGTVFVLGFAQAALTVWVCSLLEKHG
jgi:hypothetical protein